MFLRANFKLSWQKIGIVGLVIVITLAVALFFVSHTLKEVDNGLPPGTIINQVNVSSLKPDLAVTKLKQQHPVAKEVQVLNASSSGLIKSSELGLSYNYDQVVNQQLVWFQSQSPISKLAISLTRKIKPQKLTIVPEINPQKTRLFLTKLENKIGQTARYPSIELTKTGKKDSLIFHQTKPGLTIDFEASLASFNPTTNPPRITINYSPPLSPLTQQQINKLKKRAKTLVGSRFNLIDEKSQLNITITDQELVSFINPYGGWLETKVKDKVSSLAKKINREPINAKFEYDHNTLSVKVFQPNQPGLKLDEVALTNLVIKHLNQLEQGSNEKNSEVKIKLPLVLTPAKIKLKDTNNLGINELIGKGESYYYHSIPSRVHNVNLASKKVNNIIIKPKEEFSFNQAVGEVSKRTGYKEAYVIRNGRTEKGDGGGVCQVSTTLFRAALDTGLDITRRVPHSYRVSYYELNSKPGVDATVFNGNTDLRFINDTPAHILIRSINDPKKRYLRYEVYGTNDGRQTEITNHKVWGFSSPPPPEYILDPSLPAGAKKQIDWAVGGAKAKFDHIIKDKNGKIIKKQTYTSNYKPWSAKYLVGPGWSE